MRLVQGLALTLALLILTGCGSGSKKESPNEKVDAAKAELKAATQRQVQFKVEPAESSARIGETVRFVLKVTNKGKEPIEGLKFYTSGPWIYVLDRTIQPGNGKLEMGLADTISTAVTVAPGKTVDITVTGTIAEGISIKEKGHEFSFSPTVTLDGKKITGAEILQAKVYVLPKK